ncbi:rhomboid family intramembrane serine protease [Virgibacillus dakarensis]|nr:rhomboid family intramembrane serine protease [Virgibacillus dakarensis]
MYVNEQYTMYRLAYHLVKDDRFEVLHINDNQEEIWLERYANKQSQIIRLLHHGFDWKNHLKKDIAIVFQKTKAMKRLLQGKNVQVHNVYVSSHAPVDDWEELKMPMQLNEKNPVKMNVYYVDDESGEEELSRLYRDVDGSVHNKTATPTDSEKEEQISYYQKQLTNSLYNKQKEAETVFSHGKPFLTYLLLLVNILMFFLLEINGGSTATQNLIDYGAKYNPAIMDGEWWRIVSSMFLHIGLLHLFMNMLALYYLGPGVERIYGSGRFIIIYFLSGIGAGLASFAMSANVSAGASGALFGLFGALLFFGLNYKKIFLQTMGKGILVLIAANIIFGFSVPQIDNSAHIGGLITGFIASALVGLPKKRKFLTQVFGFALYVFLIAGLTIFGIQNNENSASYQLVKIEELMHEDNYPAVIDHATKGLENPGDLRASLLFQRSYAYIQLGKTDLAVGDLEKVVELTNEMPEAYYNLAMLYMNQGKNDEAQQMVKKAYDLKPDDKQYQDLYEKITGQKP